ncbi:MAG: GTP-binding protein [Pseudobacteriovorax sp.]|nr:GTP-binding protein [Pseudobacteriovorax sp.]
MKIIVTILASFILSLSALGIELNSKTVWNITEGLENPESAYYDDNTKQIFVSNVAGGPGDVDGNGFISKIGIDGRIISLKWIEGLNAPKGIRSYGNLLYVTDITSLVVIDIDAGKVIEKVAIPNAVFLNDIAIDRKGGLYVSDFLGNAIYSYQNGEVKLVLQSEDLEFPNGLTYYRGALFAGSWGGPAIADDFTTEFGGQLLRIDLKDSSLEARTDRLGNLDGLESLGFGYFLATDFIAGKILIVSTWNSLQFEVSLSSGSADLGYVPQKRLILVPNLVESTLSAIRIRP